MDGQMDGQGDYYRTSTDFVWQGPNKSFYQISIDIHVDFINILLLLYKYVYVNLGLKNVQSLSCLYVCHNVSFLMQRLSC